MNHMLLAPLLLPLVAGMLNLLLVRSGIAPQRLVSITTTGALLAVAILLFPGADAGRIDVYSLGNWPAPFGIVLVLDRLSALMLLLTALLALPTLLHATFGDDQRGRDFHVLFPLQLLGINGAFLTGDLFNLFVFFEILLIASYCLALHGSGPQRTRTALRYVVLNLIGSCLFLLALGTIYGICGTLNMADLAGKVSGSGPEQGALLHAAALLLLTVFGLKSAILPLFLWLPGLYASVLPSVAALFAIMTKVGVYAILRTQSLIFTPHGPVAGAAELLLPLALFTMAAGALGVLGSRRVRDLIAYLVIVSVGTLLAGIGLWTQAGISAALYYLPHTTLITAGLFLLTEHIAQQRGQTDDRIEPGAPLSQPTLLGILFLVGAAVVAGLPPLSGFIGKILLLQATSNVQAWLWPMILGAGLAALLALSRAGIRIFWESEGAPPTGVVTTWGRLAPTMLLILAGVLMALFAAPLQHYTEATAAQIMAPQTYVNAVLPEVRQ
jgi:multicomponent K+:H+ antiporter subunit D